MSKKQKLARNERNEWSLPFVQGLNQLKPVVTKFDDVAWTKELLARPASAKEVQS